MKPADVQPLAAPVPTHEVKVMPSMVGSCRGAYTEEAKAASIEGRVVLDLVVAADGTTRDIKVVKGLGHGLDKAAIAALTSCHFRPGTRNRAPVAVQLRTFKVRFFLDEGR